MWLTTQEEHGNIRHMQGRYQEANNANVLNKILILDPTKDNHAITRYTYQFKQVACC